MTTYLVGILSLSALVGGTSIAAGDLTDSTTVALSLVISGMFGVGWLVNKLVNWKRDLEEEIAEVRREAGLPIKPRKGRK